MMVLYVASDGAGYSLVIFKMSVGFGVGCLNL